MRRHGFLGWLVIASACGPQVGVIEPDSSTGDAESGDADDGASTFADGSDSASADGTSGTTGDVEGPPMRLLMLRATEVEGSELIWAEVGSDGVSEPASLHAELDASTFVDGYIVLHGTELVAFRTVEKTDDYDLFVAGVDGLVKVDEEPASVQQYEWVEGARTLVYVRYSGDAFRVPVVDGVPEDAIQIAEPDLFAHTKLGPVDAVGMRISASVGVEVNGQIPRTCWVASVDPDAPTDWVPVHDPDAGDCWVMGFVTDGIVYATGDDPPIELWVRRFEDGELEAPVRLAGDADTRMSTGPYGVVYRTSSEVPRVYFLAVDGERIGERVLLSASDVDATSFYASSDGRWVAVQSGTQSRVYDLAAFEPDGIELALPDPYYSRAFSWFQLSDDGRWLAAFGARGENEDRIDSFWRFDLSSGNASDPLLLVESQFMSARDLSGDGHGLGFTTSADGADGYQLWRLEVVDGVVSAADVLPTAISTAFEFAPDGGSFAYGELGVRPRMGDWIADFEVFGWAWWDPSG